VFDWVFKIETWVSLMIIVIIARFVTAWAGMKKKCLSIRALVSFKR